MESGVTAHDPAKSGVTAHDRVRVLIVPAKDAKGAPTNTMTFEDAEPSALIGARSVRTLLGAHARASALGRIAANIAKLPEPLREGLTSCDHACCGDSQAHAHPNRLPQLPGISALPPPRQKH